MQRTVDKNSLTIPGSSAALTVSSESPTIWKWTLVRYCHA